MNVLLNDETVETTGLGFEDNLGPATKVDDSPEATDAERSLSELISEIAHTTDETAQQWLVDDFLRQTERLNKSIASALCRDFKADRNTWLDDFCQTVRIAAQALLEEVIANPEKCAEIQHYPSLLKFRARSAAVRFVDSSAGFNGASGQANLKRRRRELERTRAFLYANGGEPSDEEIVEATNKRMLASRSDAHRQGMICTVEDLRISEVTENIEDHAHPVSADTVESESELHSVERQALIDACIAACHAENEQLGRIAEMWFNPATDDAIDTYDGHPTAASIALIVGIEASTARAKVARVRQVAQRVARERFGLRAGTDV